jgi:hypothetical protein
MTNVTCAAQDDWLVSCSSCLVSLFLLTRYRVAVVFALQSWLAETPEQKKTTSTPAYFQVGMSGMCGCLHSYLSANHISAMSLVVVSSALDLTFDN